MATDLIKAADDARRILKGFRAFAEVADALEAAGQAELRAAEAARVLADLQPKIDAAKASAADAEAQAANTLALASQQAAEIVAQAEAKAAEVKADAEAIIAGAEVRAAKATAKAEEQCTALREAAMSWQVKSDALTKEVDALEAKLAEARTQVAKLLG